MPALRTLHCGREVLLSLDRQMTGLSITPCQDSQAAAAHRLLYSQERIPARGVALVTFVSRNNDRLQGVIPRERVRARELTARSASCSYYP